MCRQSAEGVYEDENGRYDIHEQFRATLVSVRQGGRWRLAGLQLSPINMGLSAHTTAMVLRRFVSYLSQEPDWIVCFLGGGDATRVGPEPNKTQASPEETAKNFEAMRRIAAKLTNARWVWITPPTFHEERAIAYPPFRMGQSHWRNEDVLAIGDLLREQEEPVVDIQALFGTPADPELQGPDGVHPSLAGQGVRRAPDVVRSPEETSAGVIPTNDLPGNGNSRGCEGCRHGSEIERGEN